MPLDAEVDPEVNTAFCADVVPATLRAAEMTVAVAHVPLCPRSPEAE
jgi:hypothetical protein